MDRLHQKLENLKSYIAEQGSMAIAFSGGVDSTFLTKVAHDVLGDRMIAVTARSASFPRRELQEAIDFCKAEGIRHIEVDSEELDIPEFRHNPKNRCYLCKKETFGTIIELAKEEGLAAVAEGSNMDDNGDYRPGLMAVAELKVLSPLRHAELYKDDIRELSKEMQLPTWDKPSFACLSSRFVYGEEISEERLHMVDQAEQLLMDMGFRQLRVRVHGGNIARIEVLPIDLPRLIEEGTRTKIVSEFKKIGFLYVTMDLQGYRMGSMNEMLSSQERKLPIMS